MKEKLYPVIGIALIFICTTLGSLLEKKISPKLTKIFTGFATGVMLSASFFSLINPAIDSDVTYMPTWLIAGIAIILGGLFLWGIDKIVPHLHMGEKEEGLSTNNK